MDEGGTFFEVCETFFSPMWHITKNGQCFFSWKITIGICQPLPSITAREKVWQLSHSHLITVTIFSRLTGVSTGQYKHLSIVHVTHLAQTTQDIRWLFIIYLELSIRPSNWQLLLLISRMDFWSLKYFLKPIHFPDEELQHLMEVREILIVIILQEQIL